MDGKGVFIKAFRQNQRDRCLNQKCPSRKIKEFKCPKMSRNLSHKKYSKIKGLGGFGQKGTDYY